MIKTTGATLTISISKELKEKINLLIASGRFSSASEVLRTALRRQLAKEHHNQLIEEAHRDFVKGELLKVDLSTNLEAVINQL